MFESDFFDCIMRKQRRKINHKHNPNLKITRWQERALLKTEQWEIKKMGKTFWKLWTEHWYGILFGMVHVTVIIEIFVEYLCHCQCTFFAYINTWYWKTFIYVWLHFNTISFQKKISCWNPMDSFNLLIQDSA